MNEANQRLSEITQSISELKQVTITLKNETLKENSALKAELDQLKKNYESSIKALKTVLDLKQKLDPLWDIVKQHLNSPTAATPDQVTTNVIEILNKENENLQKEITSLKQQSHIQKHATTQTEPIATETPKIVSPHNNTYTSKKNYFAFFGLGFATAASLIGLGAWLYCAKNNTSIHA